MSVTLPDLFSAIGDNLVAAGLVQACDGVMRSSATPPTFEMEPDTIEFDQSLARGLVKWNVIVRGLVGLASDQGAQANLWAWMAPAGSDSVKVAIEADRTLGGLAQNLVVRTVSRPAVYSTQGGQSSYYGAEWQVEIWTAGT